MSADLLRRAAAKLRETADMTLPAPWTVIAVPGDRGYDVAAFPSQTVYVAQDLSESDAAWIALMSPARAEPLAALLDETASQYDGPKCDAPHGCNNCESRFDFVVAIDLARDILGEVTR